MKKNTFLKMSIILAGCLLFTSCKISYNMTIDHGGEKKTAESNLDNNENIDVYSSIPFIFIGEFTGNIIKNKDGYYYKEFHVLERLRGDTDDYILIYNYHLSGVEENIYNENDLPFNAGEKYLLMTEMEDNVYHDKYYHQGVLYCPVGRFEESFMVTSMHDKISLLSMGYCDYDSFLLHLKYIIGTSEPRVLNALYYIDSENIYDIIKAAPQIIKVKVVSEPNHRRKDLYSDYICRVETVYKGNYDLESGHLIGVDSQGNQLIRKPYNNVKHYFSFRLFDEDIDLDKTDEYIICNNYFYLIARKGVISLDYTEEEIVEILEEIYGEVNILEIPEKNAFMG